MLYWQIYFSNLNVWFQMLYEIVLSIFLCLQSQDSATKEDTKQGESRVISL